ncbi:MAG: ParB/RepB/Spo0J family partition protein [Thermodesulfobacteriota bacterium]
MLSLTETPKKRTALGQGLDALIPFDESTPLSERSVKDVPIDSLEPNQYQPRRVFEEESLCDLSNSIREMGVIQPLIVRSSPRGTYEIVAGERRWRAAAMAGFNSIPVIVREMSDSESLEVALIENLQRENLNAIDTAEAYDTLIHKFQYTHESLATRIGKDRTSVTNHLRLLKLPDPIKEDLRQDRLSMGHARTLLAIDDIHTQLVLSRKITRNKLSVRDIEKIVQNWKLKQERSQPREGRTDPELRELETSLSGHLGTRVRIRFSSGNGGKVEISFHSREELNGLVELLGCREDFS